MRKEYRYRIRFEDDPAVGPWVFNLFTTEEKADFEIESLIEFWREVNDHNFDNYCPVDVMDDLVADHPGWRWEDGDEEIIIIMNR